MEESGTFDSGGRLRREGKKCEGRTTCGGRRRFGGTQAMRALCVCVCVCVCRGRRREARGRESERERQKGTERETAEEITEAALRGWRMMVCAAARITEKQLLFCRGEEGPSALLRRREAVRVDCTERSGVGEGKGREREREERERERERGERERAGGRVPSVSRQQHSRGVRVAAEGDNEEASPERLSVSPFAFTGGGAEREGMEVRRG